MASNRELKNIKKAVETTSDDQRLKIISMLETHKRSDIAKAVGISESKLKRIARHYDFKFTYAKARPYMKYSEKLVNEVIDYFEVNGIKKTKDKYPDVSIRSIIERYPRKKSRQIRWTEEEIIQAIKFGPFVSNKDQYKYFNRPRAYSGSIRALWSKRIKGSKLRTHGLPFYIARDLVTKKAVLQKTVFKSAKYICTWQTLKENLRSDCPEFIKIAIHAGYDFHVWLYGENPNKAIQDIYKEFNEGSCRNCLMKSKERMRDL